MKKILKILLLLIIALSSIKSLEAYDETYSVDLSGLGNIHDIQPVDVMELQITGEVEKEVYIQYTSTSCENTHYLEIMGIGQLICSGTGTSGTYNLQPGVYQLIFADSGDTSYTVGEVFVGVKETTIQATQAQYNSTFGNINDYFTPESFKDFILIEIGLYLFALVVVFFFKILIMLKAYLNRRKK